MPKNSKLLALIGSIIILPTFLYWLFVGMYYLNQKSPADKFFEMLPEIGGGLILIGLPVLAYLLNTFALYEEKKPRWNRLINYISILFLLIFILSLFR